MEMSRHRQTLGQSEKQQHGRARARNGENEAHAIDAKEARELEKQRNVVSVDDLSAHVALREVGAVEREQFIAAVVRCAWIDATERPRDARELLDLRRRVAEGGDRLIADLYKASQQAENTERVLDVFATMAFVMVGGVAGAGIFIETKHIVEAMVAGVGTFFALDSYDPSGEVALREVGAVEREQFIAAVVRCAWIDATERPRDARELLDLRRRVAEGGDRLIADLYKASQQAENTERVLDVFATMAFVMVGGVAGAGIFIETKHIVEAMVAGVDTFLVLDSYAKKRTRSATAMHEQLCAFDGFEQMVARHIRMAVDDEALGMRCERAGDHDKRVENVSGSINAKAEDVVEWLLSMNRARRNGS